MGRASEYRKACKPKRWGNMARVFTKLGKEITIAVKAGRLDPDTNSRLRVLVQTAKKESMPKESVEHAIKKVTDEDSNADYKEMNYEDYGPHGIVIFIETATDNTTRMVVNVRSYFNKFGGSLGTTGSLGFLLDHHCVFHVQSKAEVDQEELILDLIDYGAEDIERDEGEWVIEGDFSQNGALQAKLEELRFEISSVEFIRVPKDTRSVSAEEREELNKLTERPEEDEDVQNAFTNMEDEEK